MKRKVLTYAAAFSVVLVGVLGWKVARRVQLSRQISDYGAATLDYGWTGQVVTCREIRIPSNHRSDFPGLLAATRSRYDADVRVDQVLDSLGAHNDVVSLDLCGAKVTAENLDAIEKMRGLKRLFVDAALTPASALAHLRRNRPDLEIVDDPNDREWLRMFPPSASEANANEDVAAAILR